ncbi:transcriptional regulator with XRE-family HTH domain [Herbihabitans rhizosphaerae]|uniref:Transcriptional regulator with XRE-family HTH domain n=1 Tax=Herbihabitans rhizosphaerae TaxID=1872711 RepID=A0A4Q7KVY5_9PSEU|nr:helix-turn-helix domain-containing protein [Herbihabitans rhizosphaerae]RZS40736.1 transcriptional regulator with XRE-family HTH domain [Herbihabitans rhizosphaerae]
MDDHVPGPARSLADKLDHLFRTTARPDGEEYSYEQVAAAITATGVTISQSYVWALRKAKKDNPTFRHLQALAGFFGVPVSYFFDDEVTDRVDEQLAELQAERERLKRIAGSSEAQLMALRAGELSPDGRRQVMELLEVVHRLERAERGDGPNE